MTRKAGILMLYFLSWPVNSLHRLWNSAPAKTIYWYFADSKVCDDIQWYIHDLCQCISYIMIFIATYLYIDSPKKKDPDVLVAFGAILVNQILDLIHYLGWHRRSEAFLFLEGIIILLAALKIFLKNRKMYK